MLIAEDSPTVRALLVDILESDPEIEVVGEARNGQEAVEMAARLRPNLITMDVEMPVMDGLEATKEIMVLAPTPILVVSSQANPGNIELSLNAVRAGALMVVPTPASPESDRFEEERDYLRSMVRAMAAVKVVRRRMIDRSTAPAPRGPRRIQTRLVAMAASTGGPEALRRILSELPGDFRVPIVVVQHMALGFIEGLAHWLTGCCNLHVKVAEHGEQLRPRTVYVAPDQLHLTISPHCQIALSNRPPIDGFRPSATYLFKCAARVYGASMAAVILTGMGRDGVDGLRAVRAAGGLVLAQDEETSVVYGMPREAIAAGVVEAVLPLAEIAPRLVAEVAAGDLN